MLFNGCVTIVYILIGTFGALVTFIGMFNVRITELMSANIH
jgi:hypothetical protein